MLQTTKEFLQDFLKTVDALVQESKMVYLSQGEEEDLIHFRNTIENCASYMIAVKEAIKSESI